jgi:Kef-type K+ transport system membrane component KefB
MSQLELSILFFLQLAVILMTCRAVGAMAKYIGQPQVVGEMIAGVLLGPSLLGLLSPAFSEALFPAETKPLLFAVSQVGLSLYMFLVGTEFRTEHFAGRAKTAVAVSVAGMLAPFVLGAALGIWFFYEGSLFPDKVQWYEAVLFMGASLCITAFPMLARIIVENKLAGTALGTLAIAAGAIDDVAAWCMLAIVISSFAAEWSTAALAIGGGTAFAFIVLVAVRPALRWLVPTAEKEKQLTAGQLVFVLSLLMFASYLTDRIGVYAVFGAFLLGCAMPRGVVTADLKQKLEPLTVSLLLPLFFTFSGLNTRLDLVTTPYLIFISAVVLFAATLGKGVACWGAARLAGEDQRTALAVGALMNARGLMELILLNIGRERGIVGPELFSIMVVMAIATTLLATPVFRYVYPEWNKVQQPVE